MYVGLLLVVANVESLSQVGFYVFWGCFGWGGWLLIFLIWMDLICKV